MTAEALASRIGAFGHKAAHYVGTMERGVESVAAASGPGDAILTLGAGSVYQAGDKILERLRSER